MELAIEGRRQQFLAVAETLVEVPVVEVRALADGPNPKSADSRVGDGVEGGIDQLGTALLASLFCGSAAMYRHLKRMPP